MEFVKVDKSFCNQLFLDELSSDSDVYILKDDTILGYGFIYNTNKDMIYFHILEEYRGNGYGTILFQKILDVLKEQKKLNSIELAIPAEDVRCNRILKKFGGVETHSENKKVYYVIPLEKKSA